jgi:hypothetical protein
MGNQLCSWPNSVLFSSGITPLIRLRHTKSPIDLRKCKKYNFVGILKFASLIACILRRISLFSSLQSPLPAMVNFSVSLFSPLFSSFFFGSTVAQGLNITVISAANGASTLECWALTQPPANFAGAVNYPLGDFEGAFVGVIPPKTHIGQAWAPSLQ